MQIPTGNFGQSVARPGQAVDLPRGNPIAQANGQLQSTLGGIVEEAQQRDLKRQDDERRAQAALTLAKTTNAMHDAHDEVARGVSDGSIGVDQAPAELQKRVGKVREDVLNGYADPTQRAMMEAHLTTAEGTLQRNLQATVQKRQQHNAAASIDDFGEQMGRFATRAGPAQAVANYSSFVRNAGPSAGLDEKAQGQLVQKFTEKAHSDFYTQAGVAALTNGDDGALRKLREQITGPDGDPLDPQKRAVLTHTLFGWEQSILARRDRAANQDAEEFRKRTNEAVDVFNKGTDVALSGGFFSPEFVQEMVTTSAGTPVAGAVQNLIASQRTIAGFASRTAAERAATIEQVRGQRADPGQGTDPAKEKLLNAMVTMDGKLRQQAEENPWAAAQQAGVIKEAPVFNMADPATTVQAIQQRMQQISAVENWTGRRVSPLQPAEIDQLGKFVRQLPLDQAASMLGSIGASMGDSERVAALGKQLHDKDGTLGLAMMYATAQTTQGRKTAELVLRGEQALKDKAAMVDKAAESGWLGTIAKTIRGAYSNREAEDQVIDAAFKITAANYADGKGADIPNAVNLATGGIIERNGQKIPLPYGMKEGDFEKKLEAFTPADLAPQTNGGLVYVGRTPMPLDQFVATLPKATLVHAGQGRYNVRAGTSLVTNGLGERITLRIAP